MTAGTRLEPFAVLRFDFFLAVKQRLHAALPLFRFVRIESMFDSAQRYVQRHAALFPTLNQLPIDRAEHQMLATAANESVFDFREVAKIVQSLEVGVWSLRPNN